MDTQSHFSTSGSVHDLVPVTFTRQGSNLQLRNVRGERVCILRWLLFVRLDDLVGTRQKSGLAIRRTRISLLLHLFQGQSGTANRHHKLSKLKESS